MILFLAINDWANVGYVFAESLKRVGVDACAVKVNDHDFDYPESATTIPEGDVQGAVDQADTVVLMHSDPALLTSEINYSGKKLAVFHGGSQYRQEPEFLNRLFNSVVDLSIVQTGDLLDLGAKNEHWVMPCVDVDKYEPDFTHKDKLIAGHFPRGPGIKGTYYIEKIMRLFPQISYLQSAYTVPWKENLERVKRCDIYIDAMQPVIDGRTYGEWGVQALEAAALGKVILSHHLTKERYEKAFSGCPIMEINNTGDLTSHLSTITTFHDVDRQFIRKKKKETRKWVEENHSYEVTGERLKKIFEEGE